MSSPTTPSYWCYRCNRFVQVWRQDSVTCPECESGFIEEIENPPHMIQTEASRERHRSSGDRSPINPVIVLRGGPGGAAGGGFELYYDDGGGSGLRPLPRACRNFYWDQGLRDC
ncbi:hypothetical protein NC653_026024 [Populus alba x Populus x berolinensis]|uniref:RING-type E3 ubiquitin transferase n=1 Tax=Populus alba x Populus x berolinensis TaxID=444605 RepID=A0AAD6MCL6_9ROSI|nr:hypothetical protein NC653_026024 [Populus alba x Populus x berolinensis]